MSTIIGSRWIIDLGPCLRATCPQCGSHGWQPIEGTRPTGVLVECVACLALFVTPAQS